MENLIKNKANVIHVLMDSLVTINGKNHVWPRFNEVGFVKIKGYKYTLLIRFDSVSKFDFDFQVYDADYLLCEVDRPSVVRDWIVTNVVTKYL